MLKGAPYLESYRGRVVGVALTQPNERPYFLIRDPSSPQRFPEELLWSDIHRLQVIEDETSSRKA